MNLLPQILSKIQKAAVAGDLDQISRLNVLAKRVREIEEGRKAFEEELAQITAEIAGNAPGTSASHTSNGMPPSGPLAVEIDFPRLGINRPPATISERQASDTMRKVFELLVEVRGVSTLQGLTQLRVNRGPLISSDPQRDYTNPQTGQPYSNQPIGNTGYFVLTHSATTEKVRDLGLAAQALGFSPLHFRVRKTDSGKPNSPNP